VKRFDKSGINFLKQIELVRSVGAAERLSGGSGVLMKRSFDAPTSKVDLESWGAQRLALQGGRGAAYKASMMWRQSHNPKPGACKPMNQRRSQENHHASPCGGLRMTDYFDHFPE